MDRIGIKWSKEETILAFDLYCRTSLEWRCLSSKGEDVYNKLAAMGDLPESNQISRRIPGYT